MRLFFAENLFANECAVCALVTRLCAAVFNYVRFTVGNRRNAISISDIMAIGTICAWIKTNGNLRDSHRCVSIPVTCRYLKFRQKHWIVCKSRMVSIDVTRVCFVLRKWWRKRCDRIYSSWENLFSEWTSCGEVFLSRLLTISLLLLRHYWIGAKQTSKNVGFRRRRNWNYHGRMDSHRFRDEKKEDGLAVEAKIVCRR